MCKIIPENKKEQWYSKSQKMVCGYGYRYFERNVNSKSITLSDA